MRKCPYCAELIREEATACPHCTRAVEAVPKPNPLMRLSVGCVAFAILAGLAVVVITAIID